MDKDHPPVKFSSFGRSNGYTASPTSHHSVTFSEASDQLSRIPEIVEEDSPSSDSHHNTDQVCEDIDRFTDALSTTEDKSDPPEIPDAVETFTKIIESRISKYYSGDDGNSFGKMTEDDAFFLQAVTRLSKLTNAFSEYPSSSTTSSSLNRTSLVLQRAMTFLEEEFRALLEESSPRRHHNSTPNSSNSSKVFKYSSFSHNSKHDETGRCQLQEPDQSTADQNDFPGYSPEIVAKMNRIATTMIAAGYETECCQVYSVLRRNAFTEQMRKLEFEKINMEDVHRMPWDSLEGEISRWMKLVKTCSKNLFPGERQLSEEVFPDYPLICRSLFSNLARAVVIQLLDFAEAVSMTKRSAEKLFKFLDVYESLKELIPAISESCSDDCEHELNSEIVAVGQRIGEAAVNIFTDLEASISSDASRTPVPGGAVHPLTRYVMNYLKYACEYKATLEVLFEEHEKHEDQSESLYKEKVKELVECESSPHSYGTVASSTPFSFQLVKVMELLDTNLESKSTLYKDLSLRYIFLMNNGRYILQKVKGSAEIHQVMGDIWCRRRSTIVRQYHKNYQRETWGKVLQILSHDGLLVNGKLNKQLLKERFKAFSMMFDEIHRMQSNWVVSDEQLQSELRVSITAVVIPAYRSFLGRFRQYLDKSRQAEKYIKYQPEDVETLIEDLFDGNPTSMARRR